MRGLRFERKSGRLGGDQRDTGCNARGALAPDLGFEAQVLFLEDGRRGDEEAGLARDAAAERLHPRALGAHDQRGRVRGTAG